MKLAGHVWDAAVVITRMRYKNRAVLGMVRSRFGCFVDTKMPSVGRHVRQFELTGHSETSTIVQEDAIHRVLERKYNTVAGSRGLGTLTGGTHEHKTVETVYLA